MRTNGLETALGNFRSVRPQFVIWQGVRPDLNFAVDEYSIAVLIVQRPLSLRHSLTFWRGAGLAVINIAKTQYIQNVQKGTIGLWLLGNLLLVKSHMKVECFSNMAGINE